MLNYKKEICSAEDIMIMADLLRNMVKSSSVIDCHEFMKSIFNVPGQLRRTDIELIRKDVAKNPL